MQTSERKRRKPVYSKVTMANRLWKKLVKAFNAEAATYVPNAVPSTSQLGSIGPVESREVLRGTWWRALDGDSYGDYYELTSIIEGSHRGEQLETGIIRFGS